jgi:hypothetical protein
MMRKLLAGATVATLFVAGSALAQGSFPGRTAPPQTEAPETGAAGFPVGPLNVFPGLDLAQGYDDNLFWTHRNTKSSAFTVASPYVRAETVSGASKYDATLRLSKGWFWDSSNDNYFDYSLIGNADIVFDGRTGLKLRPAFQHGHDPRGSTDRAATKTPQEYNNYGIDGIFYYGAPGAQGRIEIDAGAFARRYTNYHDVTDNSNRNTWQLGGTFFWRIMPRTEVLVGAKHRDIHYTEFSPPPTLSSAENAYFGGLKWEATAATTGILKLGYLTKNFDNSARKDYSSFAWEAAVRWSPLSYSVFDFVTSKTPQESTGVGDAIINSNYNVTWSHAWSSRLRSQLLAGYVKSNFVDAAPRREDDTATFGARLKYDFRRWLIFGAEYTHTNRDSNQSIYDYKRNLFLLTVGATL